MESVRVARKATEVVMSDIPADPSMRSGVQVWNRTNAAFYVRVYKNVSGSLTVEVRTIP